ncbi:MAG: radical SAM protein [Deltaproteobacteria bacterium]|nr:radical SAM protein [Deltaproteobacteria bacterium]
MASVFLVNGPFVPDFCRTQRWAARTRGRVLRAPDWLAYATAVCERRGHAARLYDFPARGWDQATLGRLCRSERPDWVVLDTTTPSLSTDLESARLAREAGARVILCGPHASALPEETMRSAAGVADAIAVGEYDETVADLVEAADLRAVPGVCLPGPGGDPVRTAPRPLIRDLDRLPFPAWHHLDLLDYFDGTKLYPYLDVVSGRGCPFHCSFCLWPQVMHGHLYRTRRPERVVDEIEHDLGLCPGVRRGGEFFFEDDTFTVRREYAHAIADEILRRRLGIRFSFNARVDADHDLLRHLRAAGGRMAVVGFESADPAILAAVDKRATPEQGRAFCRAARRVGIDVHGCFVLGLPGETRASLRATIDYALSLELGTVQFSAAVPFPGTAYYRDCAARGVLRAHSYDEWLDAGEQGSVVEEPGLARTEIDRQVNAALRRFYFRPGYVLRFLLATRSRADLYRKLRGFRNFLSFLVEDARRRAGGRGAR